MRRTVVGVIAVATACSVFSLVGMGTASAASALPQTPPGAAAAFSPASEAAVIRGLHDDLAAAWQAKDANAMRVTQASLVNELGKLQAPQGRRAMAADAVTTASKALAENNALGQDLAALMAQHGKAGADLPLPGLGSLMNLVQSLLGTLLSLVMGLLGGLPLPVGVPALPVGTPPAGH
jgi:hypothetical protein